MTLFLTQIWKKIEFTSRLFGRRLKFEQLFVESWEKIDTTQNGPICRQKLAITTFYSHPISYLNGTKDSAL